MHGAYFPKTRSVGPFEDMEGNKNSNFSGFANGRHIDLVAHFENKTSSPFAGY